MNIVFLLLTLAVYGDVDDRGNLINKLPRNSYHLFVDTIVRLLLFIF